VPDLDYDGALVPGVTAIRSVATGTGMLSPGGVPPWPFDRRGQQSMEPYPAGGSRRSLLAQRNGHMGRVVRR